MKQAKRLWAALLVLLLLSGCGYRRTEPLPYPDADAPETGKTIAYVPLDDRPDNVERVEYLAESLGYALAMPEKALYRTALDGQPLNKNGTQCGDPWALYQWVLEQEAAGCDRYILSLDQMHSGGLVSSRCLTGDELDLPGGGTVSASQILENLLVKLVEDENNVVWLLDSVMRLAPTVGYEGGTLEEYNWIRDFGAGARETLAEDALTLENVFKSYWRTEGWDWETFYDGMVKELGEAGADVSGENYYRPFGVLAANLEARERKLRLSDEVQRVLSQEGYENFHLLIGIDDSSLEDCIQKNEIAYLRRGLRTDGDGEPVDWLLSGVDDLAFKAVAKLYLEEIGWNREPGGYSAQVRYYGGTEDQPACEYDFQPLTEIMQEHLDFFGLDRPRTDIPENWRCIRVLVLTQPESEAEKNGYMDALISDLNALQREQQPVILVDASNGRYEASYYERLAKEVSLGYLLSYAGFLDMAIVTGTALSHGVARYAHLAWGETSTAEERAWARTLADSIIKDFCYKHVVREDLLAYIRNDLGGDPNNFWSPEIDREAVLDRLERGMEAASKNVIRSLERSSFLTTLDEGAENDMAHWGGVALKNYRFPWDRAFEIGMDIWLGEFR